MTFCVEKLKRLPEEVPDPLNSSVLEIQEAFALRERWREEARKQQPQQKPSTGRRPRKR